MTDLLGRVITVLKDESAVVPGNYHVRFNARDVASGIYLVKMEAGSFVRTRQIILLKRFGDCGTSKREPPGQGQEKRLRIGVPLCSAIRTVTLANYVILRLAVTACGSYSFER